MSPRGGWLSPRSSRRRIAPKFQSWALSGKSAEEIERQLARDVALSEISHALYLGREIARKEFEMKAEKARAKE